MPIKTVRVVDGRQFRLGMRPLKPVRPPSLKLRNYLRLDRLPEPPVQVDYTPKAAAALSQMYLNATEGDCVIAGSAHVIGVETGNAGDEFIFSNQQIQNLYTGICGPGDLGCDPVTVLNYWHAHGLPAGQHAIAGYLEVDGGNRNETELAIWLFENVCYCVALPDAWINPAPSQSGFWWRIAGAPDPNNGHFFPGFGYKFGGVKISTWGMLGWLGWGASAKYTAASAGGALYAVISKSALNRATGRAPNGLDWLQLQADFKALGG